MRLDGWIGALRETNFAIYFSGQVASALGSGMAPVAVAFAVLARPHAGAGQVGAVLTAGAVPLVVFLLLGGMAADHFGRRATMVFADSLRCVAEAVLAVWILVGHPPLWGFIVLSALVGTGTALFMPATTGLIRQVVSDEHRTQANALNGLSNSLGVVVGPAIAGVVVATASPGWAVLVDAVSYSVSVGSILALRLDRWERADTESFIRQLKEGWDGFRSRTWLWTIVVAASLLNVVVMAPYFVLGPVIAKQSLGGARAWGSIIAASGAGSVVGGVMMLRLRIRRGLVFALLSNLTLPFMLLVLSYRLPVPVIALGGFLGGWSLAIFAVVWDTTMQREIPLEVLGRVSAYDWFGSLVLLPIGYAIVGPVSEVVGQHALCLVGAVFATVSMVLLLGVRSIRNMQAPVAGKTATAGSSPAG